MIRRKPVNAVALDMHRDEVGWLLNELLVDYNDEQLEAIVDVFFPGGVAAFTEYRDE